MHRWFAGWAAWELRVLAFVAVALGGVGCGEAAREDAGVEGFNLPHSLASSADVLLEPAFPHLGFTHPTSMFVADGYVYVSEQGGRIYRFEDDPGARDKTLVVDLSPRTQGGNDGGLLAMAPHPEFAEEGSSRTGHLYIHYLHDPAPVAPDDLDHRRDTLARLSRLVVGADGRADPADELVLIEQYDDDIWHQGGGLFFHPQDGFLYLSVGDEGGYDCLYRNCQRIDRSLFGGVLRIDVDMRGGDISHPIRNTPEGAVTDHYYIPNDNPFVDEPGVLEEFYAIGLRSPHRMTHDPVDGLTWIGEVGQETMDEIDVLAPGANYQWDILEGTAMAEAPWDPTIVRPGVWTDPAWAFERSEMHSLIGGYVYRGDAMPELYGKYLFADWSSGDLFAADYDASGDRVAVIDVQHLMGTRFSGREAGISSFGRDTAGGLYVLTLGADDTGTVQKLVPNRGVAERVPARLSETGLFASLAELEPAVPFRAYDVNTPLWSDGAHKQRWVSLPARESIGWSDDGSLALPDGTLFLKHFEMALDAREPERRTRLETRVLVLTEGSLYGLSYRWNAAQDDAEVVLAPQTEILTLVSEDGETRQAPYDYPSPSQCLQCHDPRGERSLGFTPRQLLPARDGDVLDELLASERFSPMPSEAQLAALPRLAPLDDESVPLETRVRSYLDANCGHCHGARNVSAALWDARIATPLSEQGIIDGMLHGRRHFSADHRIVVPGDPSRSVMALRVASEDPDLRMPPLATNQPDPAFLSLLERWIGSLDVQAR